jgi:hypothetical protein
MTLLSAVLAACLVIAAITGLMMQVIGQPVTVLWVLTLAIGMLLGFTYGFSLGISEQNPPE